MNKLPMAKRVAVVSALVEGNSIRATARMTDVSKPTILKLLADLGRACAKFQSDTIQGVRARRVQVDEIWQFVYAKRKNVTEEIAAKHHGAGDVWTWVALDADSKLILTWRVGPRDLETAYSLMKDLAARVTHRMQLTTDGFRPYLQAVDGAFNLDIDYAMLTKIYGADPDGERRYSPATVLSTLTEVITGDPNPKHISTSYVERQNLTMRMSMRRFTRLTNAFSKKLENHAASIALHYMHYNFARVHQTLRVTPAMQAGLSTHVWSIEEIVSLMDRAESATAA
jgi:IS1 family transposase